ncbi:MAG: alcohol dehydrogenase catalytic domain-containing protein [Deltaproteobacteria bacterium]|nr:alcohol dehydrogenase catalytic domain-containing protein [Deltaproteobacteria bacterium]
MQRSPLGPWLVTDRERLPQPEAEGWVRLVVEACAPSLEELAGAAEPATGACFPRVPGGVLVGRTEAGRRLLCGGFLPCGACSACQGAQHLACLAPRRPGLDVPGGFARETLLPESFLAPGLPDGANVAEVVVLLALAGPTYQATATVGMVPGDVVVFFGPVGPGALPLQTLRAAGLRPHWVHPMASTAAAPPGCSVSHAAPEPGDLPGGRYHLLDLDPAAPSLEASERLRREARSWTFASAALRVGDGASAALPRLLEGGAPLRWIRSLHPQLALELAAMVVHRRVEVASWIEPLTLQELAARGAAFAHERAERWPVYLAQTPDPGLPSPAVD